MKLLILFFAFCSVLSPVVPPEITIFAQSKCRDTMKFVSKEIPRLLKHPSRKFLFKDIRIVWAGKAIELPDSTEGNRKFECTYGKDECYGNVLLNSLQTLTDINEWDFYKCIGPKVIEDFDSGYINFNLLATLCTPKALDTVRLLAVTNDKAKGPEYFHDAVISTPDVGGYVPYFYFDNDHKKEYNEEIQKDSVAFLCKYTHHKGRLPGC